MNNFKVTILPVLIALFVSGCGEQIDLVTIDSNDSLSYMANQLGDVMAAVDEGGKGTTAIASHAPIEFLKLDKKKTVYASENLYLSLFPKVHAAACGAAQFGSCSSNTLVRTFNSCTVGSYVLTGTVSMTWTGGSNCTLSAANQSIRISPDYNIAGNNLQLATTTTGTFGVTLTWISGTGTSKVFQYTNDGINRTVSSNGTPLLSLSTRTNSAITVTGTTRGSRSLSSSAGALEITNDTTGEVCTFQPSAISWDATNCNCATSGQWVGSCSTAGTVVVTINSCGSATVNYTVNGTTKNDVIAMDRCVQN